MNPLIDISGLVTILQELNATRLTLALQGLSPNSHESAIERLVETLFCPSQRLAVYGTLAPGEPNAWVMDGIAGTWQPGWVRGYRYEQSAGAAAEYPGMVWEMAQELQPIQLFRSHQLPQHWSRLDEFEGEGYVRILVPVEAVPLHQNQGQPSGDGEPLASNVVAIANLYALCPASIPR